MNTQTFTLNQTTTRLPRSRFWFPALGALLFSAGAVQAGEPEQALERRIHQPYGSGYEARGLGEPRKSDEDLTLDPSGQTAGNGNSGSGRSGAGSSGAGSGGGSGSGSGSGSGGGAGAGGAGGGSGGGGGAGGSGAGAGGGAGSSGGRGR